MWLKENIIPTRKMDKVLFLIKPDNRDAKYPRYKISSSKAMKIKLYIIFIIIISVLVCTCIFEPDEIEGSMYIIMNTKDIINPKESDFRKLILVKPIVYNFCFRMKQSRNTSPTSISEIKPVSKNTKKTFLKLF